ncbi:fasciclin domain-containing protein [Brevundimonas sp.]|uniref:fasciclin domain-containing protein n=1 Tax=Brevundimonas sp. TaxID=1871086 RepID=UPI002617CE40|nr:fasciclin domain-containing protein [Brevundimonas sp.]
MKLATLAGAVSAAALLAAAPAAFADHHGGGHGQSVTVGGAAMYANKTIVENAVASPIHTTLVAAVTAAGLVETLSGPGPFTVFAPTDAAFAALPAGTVETLVRPENKATLTRILTYHVVAGRVTAADVIALIQAGGGSAAITTVSGDTLTASLRGSSVILTDENGGVATVTQTDVFQSNGVIHVTDAVSIPN